MILVKKLLKGFLFILLVLAGNVFVAQRFGVISTDVVPIWSRLFPCGEPIEYSLGEIDSRFGLSHGEVLERLQEAEAAWEKNAGKNLFEYKETGNLKIRFVFDERQERTIAEDKLNVNLEQLEDKHDEIIDKYGDLSKNYNQKLAAYKSGVKEYEKKLDKYNDAVSDWNKNGGTEDEFNDLKEEKEELDEMRQKLEKERVEVNNLAGKTNNLAVQEKNLVNTYNSSLLTYKERYGEGKEFDQGLYDGRDKSITIYQFHDASDLRLVLAHEMGHALGIDHLENPSSVMYYLMKDQSLEVLQLTPEDIAAVKSVCRIK